jgi:hypothetical protein
MGFARCYRCIALEVLGISWSAGFAMVKCSRKIRKSSYAAPAKKIGDLWKRLIEARVGRRFEFHQGFGSEVE